MFDWICLILYIVLFILTFISGTGVLMINIDYVLNRVLAYIVPSRLRGGKF